MRKVVNLRSNINLEYAINVNSLIIEQISIYDGKLKNIIISLKVLDADKYEDLKKLSDFISKKLEMYSDSYKIEYKFQFDTSNTSIKKIAKYIIENYKLQNPMLSQTFNNYELVENGNILNLYLLSEIQIASIKGNRLDKKLENDLINILNEMNITVNTCLTSLTEKEEKAINSKKHVFKTMIVDLQIGKQLTVEGEVFDLEIKEIKTKTGALKNIYSFYITDYETSYICRKFYDADKNPEISIGDIIEVKGTYKKDEFYTREYYIDTKQIRKIGVADHSIIDDAPEKRVELSMKTNMSEMYSNINSKNLTTVMKKIGYKAYAVTDLGVVHSYPFLFNKSDESIKVIFGIDAFVVDDSLKLVVNPKDVMLDEETYVVFDIETTGLDPYNDKIIEIGAVKVKNHEVVGTFSEFINPEIPLTKFTTELTSITDEDVKDKETVDKVLPRFLEFIGNATLVAHNAKFDVGFMTEKCNQLNIKTNFSYIDTIHWAKVVLEDQKRFNLDALCKRFNIVNEHHHRAINDAEVTAKLFIQLLNRISVLNVNTLKDVNDKLQIDIKIAPTFTTTILVKNLKGLQTLYKLVSDSFIKNYGSGKPRIVKSVLEKNRENLLISSAPTMGFGTAGELVSMYVRGFDKEEIEEAANFYDYFQILPTPCYEAEIKKGEVSDEKYIEEMNKYMYDLSKKQGKLCVAVGNVMYMTKEESKSKTVLQIANSDYKSYKYETNAHFRVTNEMLNEFAYLDSKEAREVVITNTNLISDMIEVFRPIPKGFFPPKLENDKETVTKLTYEKAHELYGENIPTVIKERIEKELTSIINNGYAVLYLIAQKLVHKSVENGYLVGSRGSVGSSIVAYLMGITEVNGLAPHYRCPNKDCKNIEIFELAQSGVDLPEKDCPKCGTRYIRDGHAIPFEVFMGFNGDKVPDIDLNFSGEFQNKIHLYTEELFGKDHVFRAGTISTTARNNAIGYVKKYFEELNKEKLKEEINKNFDENTQPDEIVRYKDAYMKNEMSKNMAEIIRLAKMIEGTRKTTGQHPGGMVVVPNDRSIYEFCPIQKPANDVNSDSTTTHFDYHVMDEQLVKLDILGHDDPTTLKNLEDLTGISPYTLPLTDPKVLSLFHSTEALGVTPEQIGTDLGTNGIPEFGTNFVKEMLKDTLPKTFTELVRISGLSHGTDVWLNNAKDYVNDGTATLSEIISVRDDIMNYLILQGMEKSTSFKIMEFVRKGRPHKDKEQWEKYKEEMKSCGIKQWYIDSCEKIKYMFPKGHAVAYVMMAIRIAYFKVYYPLEFYTAFLNRKISSFTLSKMYKPLDELRERLAELNNIGNKSVNDKSEIVLLEILVEMYCRGIELLPVDLYKSEAKSFVINNGKIRIPFVAVDQLGEIVASNISDARSDRNFTSQEDLVKRTGINTSVLNILRKYHVVDTLPESDQQTLF